MKIAVLQCEPQSAGRALDTLRGYARRAAEAGCDVLVTPEMFTTGYNIGAKAVAAAAEPADGAGMREIAAIAAHSRLAVVAGHPVQAGNGQVRNCATLFDGSGDALLTYAKTHLFGPVDRAQFSPGGALSAVVELAGLRVALAICYDIEFPELVRALALSGADLIVCPTANMQPFDTVAARLVPARAQENGVAIAYANYVGREGEFAYCGLSCICGPDGEDLARAGGEREQLIMAEVTRDQLAAARNATGYLADRQPQLYRSLGPGTEQ